VKLDSSKTRLSVENYHGVTIILVANVVLVVHLTEAVVVGTALGVRQDRIYFTKTLKGLLGLLNGQ